MYFFFNIFYVTLKVIPDAKRQLLKISYLTHSLIFFREVIFRSQDIQVFVFLTIPWFTTRVSVHETACIFEYIYLLNHNSPIHWICTCDRYNSNNFQESWRTGSKFQVLFNLATCSNYSITGYVKIPVFHFFVKMNKG